LERQMLLGESVFGQGENTRLILPEHGRLILRRH